MAKNKSDGIEIQKFADHQVITQPNPLRKVLRRVSDEDPDDPIGRAEKALAGLSGEFRNWMVIESDRLTAAHAAVLAHGFTDATRDELFRAAHDSRETPPLSASPRPAPPPKAFAGSSSTPPTFPGCRPS
jgi:hypothetical protein